MNTPSDALFSTRNAVILVLAFLLLGWIDGSECKAQLQGSFASKFKRYQKNEPFSGTPALTWHAVAWKGERLQNQVILWSSAPLNGLTYTFSDFTNGTQKLENLGATLQWGKYIKGDPRAANCSVESPYRNTPRPAAVELIDALSHEPQKSLTPADPMKLWLTLDVPRHAAAGSYTGTLTIGAGSASARFNIRLQIVGYTLPKVADWTFHLDLWQFPTTILTYYNRANPSQPIAAWSSEHLALLAPAYRLLVDAGQKTITAHIKKGALGAAGESVSLIRWIKGNDGAWRYDFSAFERYVAALMSWGMTRQISCFSPVGWNEDIIPYVDESNRAHELSAPLGSNPYNTRWNHFLTAFKTFLDQKGWFDRTVLYLDEVKGANRLNQVITMVKDNHPSWKLGIAYSRQMSREMKARFYDLSGLLGNTSNHDIDRSVTKVSTFYTSCHQSYPNNYVTPQNSLAEMTWMPWHAQASNYNGYLRWAYDYWRLPDPWNARDGANAAGDFSMVYRSVDTAPLRYLPSLRLVMLREGIQDYEKMNILKAALRTSTHANAGQKRAELNRIIRQVGALSVGTRGGTTVDTQIQSGQRTLRKIATALPYTKPPSTNTPPLATAPALLVVKPGTSEVPLGDEIHIEDKDRDNQTVTFSITGGTLKIGTAGIRFTAGQNGSSAFKASGTLAAMNAALDAAAFTPSPHLAAGSQATLSFSANDGVADSNTATVTFRITSSPMKASSPPSGQITVLPTPTFSMLCLYVANAFRGQVNIILKNLLGYTLGQWTRSKQNEIFNWCQDVSHLPVGIYLIEVSYGMTYRVHKVIKTE